MKANKKNSYEKVEASIKSHLLCIQMLFILGLVIEGQTCPDLEEFKTSIFLIITGIVISTIILILFLINGFCIICISSWNCLLQLEMIRRIDTL